MVLPRSFYLRDTVHVARALLGQELVCRTPAGEAAGIIIETEAYLGARDPASHAFGGRRTPRTEILYAAGGRAYVYLIYGLHHCLNLTTREAGIAECVLIRALQPTVGVELMRARQPAPRAERVAAGPGRLCRALAIDRRLNGADLTGDRLCVREGEAVAAEVIVTTPRIGVGYAGAARDWPLRFCIQGNPGVTRVSLRSR